MGCDIHVVVERIERLANGEPWGWLNAGDPDLGRNYELFSALADVRNSYGVTPVAEPKGMPGLLRWNGDRGEGYGSWSGLDGPCTMFEQYYERWHCDAHSASWLTLAEVKAYDTTVEIDDPRLIVGRAEDGSVSMVAAGTTGPHEGAVGRRRIFVWPCSDGTETTAWDRLVAYMENVRAFHDLKDDEVRLVFFFDN